MARNDVKEAPAPQGETPLPDGEAPAQDSSAQSKKRKSRATVTFGRGNMGKSWLLRQLIERAAYAKAQGKTDRRVVVVDADPGNRTLAEALATRTDLTRLQPSDLSDEARAHLLSDVVRVGEQVPAAIFLDVGGNDRSTAEYAGTGTGGSLGGDYDDFGVTLDSFGNLDVTVLYVLGSEPADVLQLSYVLRSSLADRDLALVLNEGAVRRGAVPGADPFAENLAHPLVEEAFKKGAKILRLPALNNAVSRRLIQNPTSFVGAAKGEAVGSEPLEPRHRQELQIAMRALEDRITKAGLGGLLR